MLSALDRTERLAMQAVDANLLGGIPGVFQLNDEGMHNACF